MLNLSEIDNLAITGANGFVGRSIVEKIASLPQENLPKNITLVTRQGLNYQLSENLKGRSSEVTQNLEYSWTIDSKVSHLLNLAADGSKNPYSEKACTQFEKISRNLVDWIGNKNSPTKIFHASTGACFGYKPLGDIRGFDRSKDLFIKNRISVESYLSDNLKRNETTLSIGRLFSFSGKNILHKSQYAISNFVQSAVNSKKIQILGHPLTERSYLHQDSMSEWILAAVISTESYLDLQVGSNQKITLKQLADFVAENSGASVHYTTNFPPGDRYVANNFETRIKLGVEEGIGWKDAVLEMITEARILNNGRN